MQTPRVSQLASGLGFFLSVLRILCAGIDPVAIEMLTVEAIGAEPAKERTLLESRLGVTRNNRVFAFF